MFSTTLVAIPIHFIRLLLLAVSLTPSHGGFDRLLLAHYLLLSWIYHCYRVGQVSAIAYLLSGRISSPFFHIVLFLNLTALRQ
jgi:hypothetical protein